MTQAEMLKEIERLRAVNEELKAKVQAGKKPGTLTCRVSTKGAVSIYGLGRFPVTLYREQWTRLLEYGETIKAFIHANADTLALKQDQAA